MLDLMDLIAMEKAEQEMWETHILPWHPRNDGSDNSDDDSDDGDDTGDDDGDDDADDELDAGKTPEQVAIDKAHSKLRESEARERKLDARIKELERKGLGEAEKLRAELADERAAKTALESKVARTELDKEIETIAKNLKFRNPSASKRFVGPDITDAKGVRTALKEALDDFPELKGEGVPPPPVNGDSSGENGSGNARMNAAIRRAAGRS